MYAITLWYRKHSRTPFTSEWDQAGENHPSRQTVARVFGSWNAAMEAAGFTPRPRGRQPREAVFRRPELGCMNCHAINKAGGSIGPDLGPVGGSSPMDYIVQSILDPNASVKEEYLTKTDITGCPLRSDMHTLNVPKPSGTRKRTALAAPIGRAPVVVPPCSAVRSRERPLPTSRRDPPHTRLRRLVLPHAHANAAEQQVVGERVPLLATDDFAEAAHQIREADR